MKYFFSLSIVCLLLATAITTYSDIAKPKASPDLPKIVLHTSLTIVPDNKAYEGRLQIPQSDLQEFRAALANMPANESMANSWSEGGCCLAHGNGGNWGCRNHRACERRSSGFLSLAQVATKL